jgi:hypothetical protein
LPFADGVDLSSYFPQGKLLYQYYKNIVTTPITLTKHHAMEAYWWSGAIA